MKRSPRHLPALGIALLAIAGVLSAAGDVSACASQAAARSCCVDRPVADCCCATTPRPAPARPAALAVTGTASAAGFVTPASPCSCRSERPTAPARGPETTPTARHSDRLSEAPAADWTAAPRLRTRSPSALTMTGVSPGAPLFLRLSHLLI